MRHRIKGRKFGRRSNHRLAMLCNLSKAIITHKRIRTTVAKAKDLRSVVERLVTTARRSENPLHVRRLLLSKLRNDGQIVEILMSEIAPFYKERPGGFTRIIKTDFRHGDCAPMAIIEFMGYNPETRTIGSGV